MPAPVIERGAVYCGHEVARHQPELGELLTVAAGIDAVAALLAVGEYRLRPMISVIAPGSGRPGSGSARPAWVPGCAWGRPSSPSAGPPPPWNFLGSISASELAAPVEDHPVRVDGVQARPARNGLAHRVDPRRGRALADDCEAFLRIGLGDRPDQHQAHLRGRRRRRIELARDRGDAEQVRVDDA